MLSSLVVCLKTNTIMQRLGNPQHDNYAILVLLCVLNSLIFIIVLRLSVLKGTIVWECGLVTELTEALSLKRF